MAPQSGRRRTVSRSDFKRGRISKHRLLEFHKKTFPKVHDLLKLETLLIKIEPDIRKIHHYLKLLNRYYIETRYPGDYPQFTKKEAHQGFQAAIGVKKFVYRKVTD